jgi:hypothetical protein
MEIVAPLNGHNYDRQAGQPFGPPAPAWVYSDPGTFFSGHWSGAYRLPIGNTLITEAMSGYVFEVTAAGATVWDYDIPSTLARALRYNMASASVDQAAPPREGGRFLQPGQPNPFSQRTRIPFALLDAGRVRLEIFAVNGRRVATLVARDLPAGSHVAEWDGRDAAGRDVGSGTYLVRLRVNQSVEAERLVMLR